MLVACSMLSLVSVLGVFVILGVCTLSSTKMGLDRACWLTRPILRSPHSRVAARPTKRSSFAIRLRYTSSHFSYVTLFKPSADSSISRGLPKIVSMQAWHAQPKRLSSRSAAYVKLCSLHSRASTHTSRAPRLELRFSPL